MLALGRETPPELMPELVAGISNSRMHSLFGKPFQMRPTGPCQDLFLLSIVWINQERSVNSVMHIYDKEEPNGLTYETDKAGIEAENRYQRVIAIRSQKGNPQKRGHDLAR